MTISEERKVCTGSEKFIKMCDSNEVRQHVEVVKQLHERRH